MVKEAQSARMRGRLVDLKTAINIWRERVPQFCESIQMWKEVLENRNFIQDQIAAIMIPTPPLPAQNQTLSEAELNRIQETQASTIRHQRQQFLNEFLDKSWNYYKLAQVSRKQGLPYLAIEYLKQLSQQINIQGDSGEATKYELFRFDYEYMKLQLDFNTNSEALAIFMNDYTTRIDNKYLNTYKAYVEYQR